MDGVEAAGGGVVVDDGDEFVGLDGWCDSNRRRRCRSCRNCHRCRRHVLCALHCDCVADDDIGTVGRMFELVSVVMVAQQWDR